MATTIRVTRLANPRRRRKLSARRHNTAHRKITAHRKRNARRRRLTPKQIKFFGTARQKAGLKAARKRKAARHRARPRTANPRRRRMTRNPALVVTLGAVNPRRRKSMARRKAHRKHNPRRRRHVAVARRRSRNATRVVVMAPRHHRRRRSNPRRRYAVHSRRRYIRRRHNPVAVFGHGVFSKDALTMVGGGLLGVAAAKFIPTLIPATLQMGGSTIARVVITGASAWVASMVAGKLPGAGSKFADAVFFGGLMQTGSVALNALLPGFRIGGVPVALSGMGELVPGQFSVPQNPIRSLPAAPAQARVQMNGLQRVYGNAF